MRTVIAHESGDGITIAHCPFCGSGQVVGRSDGNAECQFCNSAFMVRVQPMFSAFPQSIDGMPVQIPGMPPPPPAGMDPGMGGDPGEDGSLPPGADGGDQEDSAGSGAPPFGTSGDSSSQDSGSGDTSGSAGDSKDTKGKDSGSGPPFKKKESYRTAGGRSMGRREYVAYLADALVEVR